MFAVPAKDAEALREGVVNAAISLVVVVSAARCDGVVGCKSWRGIGWQYSQDIFSKRCLRTHGDLT